MYLKIENVKKDYRRQKCGLWKLNMASFFLESTLHNLTLTLTLLHNFINKQRTSVPVVLNIIVYIFKHPVN